MDNPRFFQLLSRKMAGEATIQELDELQKLLQEDPSLRLFCDELLREKTDAPTEDEVKGGIDAAFAAHAAQMRAAGHFAPLAEVPQAEVHPIAHRRRRFWLRAAAVAASVALLAVAATFVFRNQEKPAVAQAPTNVISTKRGDKSRIALPDGTTVLLNADSRLAYANFDGGNREVSLSGEAFFDVVKDSRHPFIIHTDKINIKVLGTAFNVKAYAADDQIETALIHGKIEVTFNDRPSEKIILKPNEKLVVLKDQRKSGPIKTAAPKVQIKDIVPVNGGDSVLEETAWTNNRLAFSNEPFETIAKAIERRFDVKIEFASEAVKRYHYTGVIENESVETILDFLTTSKKFSVARQGNTYVISK